jgi:hypothetical protein
MALDRRDRLKNASAPALTVALVHAEADRPVAERLAQLLGENGIEIAGESSTPADGHVVLLSSAALRDDAWIEWAQEPRAHAIPVRIGSIEEAEVPEPLRRLNWIDWDPGRPATTLGFILAALLSDPTRYRVSQQLAHEAAAWDRTGRPKEGLIGDRRRARKMRSLIFALAADPIASPNRLTSEFVAASDKATRKAQRRRRLTRVAAAIAILTGISAVIVAIPKIQANSRITKAAIVTTGSKAVLDQMPEWSAANSSALLLKGTPTQQELGRSTLLQAMARPWAIADFAFIDSVVAMAPYNDGVNGVTLSIAPGGSGLAVVDLHQALTLGVVHVSTRLESLSISPDGDYAVAAGHGIAVLDLSSGHLRMLSHRGSYTGVRALDKEIALWTERGTLETRPLEGRGRRSVRHYKAVLDVIPAPHGGGFALVETREGDFSIVGLRDGRTLASAGLDSRNAIGALSPDGRRAIVDGADGQLWEFDREGTRPTGIASPPLLVQLQWATRERLLIASESRRAQVFFLPRAEPLGPICGDTAGASDLISEPGGETVACAGFSRTFWKLPPVPRPSPDGAHATGPVEAVSAHLRVTAEGRWVQISAGPPADRANFRVRPFDSKVTAAAIAPDGRQVALGSSRGNVLVYGLSGKHLRGLVTWQAPDGASIVKLRWRSRLSASTASKQLWALPSCPGCETDSGLIAAARARFSGCFSARQMEWVDSEVRRLLALRECESPLVIGEE